MSDSEIEVINPHMVDNLKGVVIDGVPHLYWLHIYHALGLSRQHARMIILKLTEGTHYRAFTRDEIRIYKDTVNKLFTVPSNASKAFFLTEEGYHRAIMEIQTSYMNDEVIASKIDALKDKIANIYTRYKSGEVLSIADERPMIVGQVEYPDVSKVLREQMSIADVMIDIGVEPSIARTIAFSVTESICNCGDTLTPWKNLVKTDPLFNEPALLKPTDIGRSLGGMSPQTINKLLEKFGYQEKIGSEWVPTKIGSVHSKLIPQEILHNRGMMRKLEIKWQPSIVEKIRERLFYDDKGQTSLFIGEVGS